MPRAMLTPESKTRSAGHRLIWDGVALTFFTAAAMLLYYPMLAGGLARDYIGNGASNDPQIFIWGLAWYPYALTHGIDPLYTTAAFAPSGYNLAWSTTIPAAALALWPVTHLCGPLVSFNLLRLLIPILSAYAAFALCRHITAAPAASLAGALVFGFSTYQRIEADHPNLDLTFLLPVMVLLFLRRIEGRMRRRRYVLLLAACLIAQFLISPEIFALAILFGVAAIALYGWLAGAAWRSHLRDALGEIAAAIVLAVVILSPYLYRFIPSPFGLTPIYNPAHCSIDLLGFVLPTDASLASALELFRTLSGRIGFGCEPVAYLGLLPLIAIGGVLAPRYRRRNTPATESFLVLLLAAIALLALGPIIHVAGRPVAPSLWLPAVLVPILNNALPARFMLFAFLVLAVMMALWLSDTRRHPALRWLIGLVAIASVIPTAVPSGAAALPFFDRGLYRRYLTPAETVMFLPYGYNGQSMRWQAQSDFYFRLAGGYLSLTPREYDAWPIVGALLAGQPYIPGFGDQFQAFLVAHEAHAVIVPESDYPPYAELCATLGVDPIRVGGVLLFRLSPAAAARFRDATAAAMDTRYNLDRFERLIDAARRFIAAGHPYAELNPFSALRMGLLDPTLTGDPIRSQTAGFPLMRWARGNAAFQNAARLLISRGMIRERLAVELGPLPPGNSVTSSGIWLGPWSTDTIAIGVVTGPRAAARLRDRFGPHADDIYYPYPLPFSMQPDSAPQQMLLMTFKVEALPAIP